MKWTKLKNFWCIDVRRPPVSTKVCFVHWMPDLSAPVSHRPVVSTVTWRSPVAEVRWYRTSTPLCRCTPTSSSRRPSTTTSRAPRRRVSSWRLENMLRHLPSCTLDGRFDQQYTLMFNVCLKIFWRVVYVSVEDVRATSWRFTSTSFNMLYCSGRFDELYAMIVYRSSTNLKVRYATVAQKVVDSFPTLRAENF